jgi:hypothetical protein
MLRFHSKMDTLNEPGETFQPNMHLRSRIPWDFHDAERVCNVYRLSLSFKRHETYGFLQGVLPGKRPINGTS